MDHFMLGEMAIHRIHELLDPDCSREFLFPDMPPEVVAAHLGWMAPEFYDRACDRFLISIHSWVVKTRRHTILIDACGGNHKQREKFPFFHQRNTPYLDNLKAAGFTPQDIDVVFCTHLHVDHVGWNTRLDNGRWVPTFPNARYLFSRKEYEGTDPAAQPPDSPLDAAAVFEDSVLPVVQAGLSQLVEDGFQIDDECTVEPAPGHTPGHCLLRACSRGHTGLFTGDAMHHPIQIAEPDSSSGFCADPRLASMTRRRILEDAAAHNHLLLPAHFTGAHVGRVSRKGDRFSFRPGL